MDELRMSRKERDRLKGMAALAEGAWRDPETALPESERMIESFGEAHDGCKPESIWEIRIERHKPACARSGRPLQEAAMPGVSGGTLLPVAAARPA